MLSWAMYERRTLALLFMTMFTAQLAPLLGEALALHQEHGAGLRMLPFVRYNIRKTGATNEGYWVLPGPSPLSSLKHGTCRPISQPAFSARSALRKALRLGTTMWSNAIATCLAGPGQPVMI